MIRRVALWLTTLLLALLLVPSAALAAKPEAEAQGKPGSGDTSTSWKYTALGDSLGTGFGALKGYVPRYRDYMVSDTKASVSLTNMSVNGWTSTDLLSAIRTDRTMRSNVKGSQVVTWDIGGNDLRAARTSYKNGTCGGADNQDCLRAAVATFQSNWNAIVAEIKSLRGTNPTIYRTMDVYNPYVAQDKQDGSFYVFKQYLDQVNAHIAGQAGTYGYQMAQVYRAFNGASGEEDPKAKNYIGLDGLHPNDTGHRVIADEFRLLGYSPLR